MYRKRLLFFILIISSASLIANKEDSSKSIIEKKIPYYFLPGAGQIKNKKWIKSFIIIGAEAAAINYWSKNALIYKNFDENKYGLPQNRYLEKRNKYAWWIVIIYFYSMVDAIVDNHFFDFNEVMKRPIEKETLQEGGISNE